MRGLELGLEQAGVAIQPVCYLEIEHLSSKIWSSKWSRVYWLKHLFSATLPNSHSKSFLEKYTASLEDIHVSHFPTLDLEKVNPILDTFGRLLRTALKNRGLYGFGSRMSKDTYHLAYAMYLRTYENWVIKLRSAYSVRQKWERPIEETGSLFSGWKTPSSSECEGGVMRNGKVGDAKYKLRDQVSWTTPQCHDAKLGMNHNPDRPYHSLVTDVNWPTPDVSDRRSDKSNQIGLSNVVRWQVQEVWPTPTSMNMVRDEETMQKCADYRKAKAGQNTVPLYLEETVLKTEWPTASARDWRSGKSNQHEKNSRPLNEVVVLDGQQDQEKVNSNGKRLGLNPAWVMQLMGTTIEKTFFAWRETPLYANSQRKPSEHC
jgi:hypothetical protein